MIAISTSERVVTTLEFDMTDLGSPADHSYAALLQIASPGPATILTLPLVDGRPADRLVLTNNQSVGTSGQTWNLDAAGGSSPMVYRRPVRPIAFAGHPRQRPKKSGSGR